MKGPCVPLCDPNPSLHSRGSPPYAFIVYHFYTYFYTFTAFYVSYMCAKLLQSCLTLCDPVDCSWPGSSVLGILQARILEDKSGFSRRAVSVTLGGGGWPGRSTPAVGYCTFASRCPQDRTGTEQAWRGSWGATAGGLPTSGLRWQPPLPGVLE